jgi:hypothetical protein
MKRAQHRYIDAMRAIASFGDVIESTRCRHWSSGTPHHDVDAHPAKHDCVSSALRAGDPYRTVSEVSIANECRTSIKHHILRVVAARSDACAAVGWV